MKPDAAGVFREARFRPGWRDVVPMRRRESLGSAQWILAAVTLPAAGMARFELRPPAEHPDFVRPFTE